MSLISSGTLTGLRTLAASVRTDACTISRSTRASDGQGGFTDAWATVATVSCYVTRLGAQPVEQVVADRLAGRVGYYLYLPHDADVRDRDRLVVGATTYEVIGVNAPATLQVHARVTCAREV